MQSEFACHIGLQGKFFCCNCWVKGFDAANNLVNVVPGFVPGAAVGEIVGEVGGQDLGSNAESVTSAGSGQQSQPQKKRRRKVIETMSSMVTRLKAFITVRGVDFYSII